MDINGYTESEWEGMWESETATSTVHRASMDDDDAWQAAYDKHYARTGDDFAATGYADEAVYG